jgi:phytanoyl-CoA hydroxylase
MTTAPGGTNAYLEHGFVKLGPLLDAADLAALRGEEQRFRPEWGYGKADNRTLRVAAQLCARSEPVRRVATAGPQVATAVSLIGPAVCLTHVQFITKLPDDESTHSDIPWHQDSGYGQLEPPNDLTVFIALSDMTEPDGCLQVVPGSHRAGLLEHATAAVNPVLRESPRSGEAIAVPLRAGEGLAFSGLLVHGSGPNRGRAPRIAFYVRYCTPDVRMMSEGGRPVLDDPHSWMVAGEAP